MVEIGLVVVSGVFFSEGVDVAGLGSLITISSVMSFSMVLFMVSS